MTLGSGKAVAALSAKQLSHGQQGTCQNPDTGTNQSVITINSTQRAKTEMSAKHVAWLGSSTHRTGVESDKERKFLKRPKICSNQVWQASWKTCQSKTRLCPEVFLSLVHDSFSKLNIRKSYSWIPSRHWVCSDCNLGRGKTNQY